jgi:flagellar basal body-associated protein FliL
VDLNSFLVPILVILVVLLIAVVGVWVMFSVGNKPDKAAERKWTDPKFHD